MGLPGSRLDERMRIWDRAAQWMSVRGNAVWPNVGGLRVLRRWTRNVFGTVGRVLEGRMVYPVSTAERGTAHRYVTTPIQVVSRP